MRDYQGYLQSRLAMVQAKPQLRQSWTGLAVAHHLAGNLDEAERILTMYEDTLKNPPLKTDIEHSEAIMYKNMIIAESRDTKRALEHLESSAKHNLDRAAVMESRARYLTELGRKDEAVAAWRALLDRNTEHPDYYFSLIKALEIGEDDVAAKKAIFDEYAEKSPRCDAARRIPLDFLTGMSSDPSLSEHATYSGAGDAFRSLGRGRGEERTRHAMRYATLCFFAQEQAFTAPRCPPCHGAAVMVSSN